MIDLLGEGAVIARCTSVVATAASDWFDANGLGLHPSTPTACFDCRPFVAGAAVQDLGVTLKIDRFAEAKFGSGQLVRTPRLPRRAARPASTNCGPVVVAG